MPKYTPSSRIHEIFSASLIHPSTAEKFFSNPPKKSVQPVDPACWVGVEVEVEKINQIWPADAVIGGDGFYKIDSQTHPHFPYLWLWKTENDNSLKENGVEYISLPLRGEMIYAGLKSLECFLDMFNPDHTFSTRCGTHIHVDCRNLTIEQVVKFIFLYLIVEAGIYKQAGKDRAGNPFCVPLLHAKHYQNLPILYHSFRSGNIDRVIHVLKSWTKYTGCNLLALVSKGTIEFRHYSGTVNTDFLMKQINMIQSIRINAISMSLDEVLRIVESVTSISNYLSVFEKILGVPCFLSPDELKSAIEAGVLTIKQIVHFSEYLERYTKVDPKSSLISKGIIEYVDLSTIAESYKHLLETDGNSSNYMIQKIILKHNQDLKKAIAHLETSSVRSKELRIQ